MPLMGAMEMHRNMVNSMKIQALNRGYLICDTDDNAIVEIVETPTGYKLYIHSELVVVERLA